MSDRAISEMCGVNDTTVASHRKLKVQESRTSTEPQTRTGKDGKSYPVKPKPEPAKIQLLPEPEEDTEDEPEPEPEPHRIRHV